MRTGTVNRLRLHTWPLLPVLLIGIFLSSYAAFAVRSYSLEKGRVQFESAASGYLALINFAFQTRGQNISALRRFFEGSEFVSIDEFKKFVEPYFDDETAALAVEWIPLVTARERSTFEAENQESGIKDFQITEYDLQGNLVRASDRPFYFPICYTEPNESNRTSIGLDLASDTVHLQVFEKARDNGKPAIIHLSRFFLKGKNQYIFRIIIPVYKDTPEDIESRRSHLMGFVAGVYQASDIVETTLVSIQHMGLNITVTDISDPNNPDIMHIHSSHEHSGKQTPSQTDSMKKTKMRYRDTITLADRTMELVCTPSSDFPGTGYSWSAWLVFIGGVMFTFFLTFHFNFLLERNRKVTALVKKKTDELNESRTLLEMAIAGADLGYWDWLIQTGEMIFSRQWLEMIGYHLDDLEPNVRSWQRIIHPDDKEKVMAALRRHLAGETPMFESEHRLRHRDGHYIWVLDRGRITERDSSGKPFRACGTHLDVTALKMANQALNLMSTAIEQFGESLIINDAAGRIQYVNSAFERITGYSRSEVIGEFPHQLPGGSLDEALFKKIVDVVKSGKTYQGMIDSQKKDGTKYYENITVSPVFDEQGAVTHHIAVRHDLTDLKRLEEEKDRIQMQYYQAQKMESIGRLAGGLAHDLNNMLGPILGFSEMLLAECDPSDQRHDALSTIHETGLRARDVVKQILAFSRKQSLYIQKIDLSAVVTGFQNLLRRTLMENIEIKYNLIPRLIINADARQLEQVLMNLAINAQDAMPDGGLLAIETKVAELDDVYLEKRSGVAIAPGKYAVLLVSDTGQGMEKEVIDHIFEPFFSTKDKSHGTGLGLAMVYGTVKQHEGYIWAYSEPGVGASFKLYFPLLDASHPSWLPEIKAKVQGGDETIMVVEDDRSVRKMAVEMLSAKGYHVMSASNGAECLNILENSKKPIDILMTDVIMPDMNGKELYSKIQDNFPDMKVIFMSGYSDEIIAHHGVLSDGDCFIQKPFSMADITSKVRSVLDEREK